MEILRYSYLLRIEWGADSDATPMHSDAPTLDIEIIRNIMKSIEITSFN